MRKVEMIYEGKAKKVYKTEREGYLIIEYKDTATAFDGQKKGIIPSKGIVNNKVSAAFFKLLEENGIKTHFVELLNDREMLVKAVQIIPIEVIVRNIAAGSLCSRLGLKEGTALKFPIVEFTYKNDELHDPMINHYHALALDLADEEELRFIEQTALKVNEILRSYLAQKNLVLVDFKLEFGRSAHGILLADEISPDTCRFWDATTLEKLDKDRFRRDLGKVEEAYWEIYKRICE
ncbi:phosphoribosylaminoimidazolesuccinocarboxamide synthase [Pseudothermotoga sp.]|nr:phosphoribosylaminoimidazolesuccinocarboxamide synthase [Pseudothermotoga sp.]MCX7813445.1 phosphoribosylaminoimidazolesuccinocarboxamide synthase [Pseudothermotoga sp.]MDW8139567.1 phosphoribosylaminoimidazolesuccinocarboxamide synthase [Pseudothermotoga sp.]